MLEDSAREQLRQHLKPGLAQQIKGRISSLLTEANGQPRLPTATALVTVAVALAARACLTKTRSPDELTKMRLKFEALSGDLKKTMDRQIKGHSARFPLP